jgi:transcription antitermination factor NusG
VRWTENIRDTQSSTGAASWYALFTRHQHEKPIALALSNKNHEVYLPLYRSVRQWQDRSKHLWFPLFPGYVFLHGGMERQLQILSTPGVIDIVRFGGHPAIVPQAQLDAVRKLLDSRLRVETHPYLQCGDRVIVTSGPLAGLQGILDRKKGSATLVVSMEMLGQSAAVEIDVSNVQRIGPLRARELSRREAASA